VERLGGEGETPQRAVVPNDYDDDDAGRYVTCFTHTYADPLGRTIGLQYYT